MAVRWFKSGMLDHVPANIFDPFPNLNRIHDAVRDHAGLSDPGTLAPEAEWRVGQTKREFEWCGAGGLGREGKSGGRERGPDWPAVEPAPDARWTDLELPPRR
jgi:hypothetical protein